MPHSGRRQTDAKAPAYAQRYGDALGVADAAAAEQVVDEALVAGLAPAAIQSLVIEPAMIRVGEQWEANTITVADEHLATAITQAVLIRLLEGLTVARARSRERILLAAAEGQVHVLGLRMVADVLEGAGYEVLYLGADVPVDALRRFAAEQQPAVTGLAVGMSVGVGALAESIHAVHEACPATKIMLGGRAVPLSLVEAGYPRVASSLEAVATVERLLHEPSRPAPGSSKCCGHSAASRGRAGRWLPGQNPSLNVWPKWPRTPRRPRGSMFAAPGRSRTSPFATR